MNKVFLFDLDGVLINDEAIWEERKQQMYATIFGNEIHEKLGSTLGVNIDGIYERAASLGASVSKSEFTKEFYKIAGDIYSTAPIPDGIVELANYLKSKEYLIGIVSASPLSWITTVTKRLSFEDDIETIISLHEREDLSHKPAPDGYLEALKALEASPDSAFVLEDSNSGIKAAKAAGIYTIGLRQNLVPGYVQDGADAYAANMQDVINIIEKIQSS